MAKFVDYDADRGVETYEDMNDGHLLVHYAGGTVEGGVDLHRVALLQPTALTDQGPRSASMLAVSLAVPIAVIIL